MNKRNAIFYIIFAIAILWVNILKLANPDNVIILFLFIIALVVIDIAVTFEEKK